MNKSPFVLIITTLLSIFLLAACGTVPNLPTVQPPPSSTPNPCAPSQIGFEIKKINDMIREFDDITFVANLTDQKLLTQPILDLQTVRRNVENTTPPTCLEDLKRHSINYMNMVINYLAHFMGGVSQEQINAEIISSQDLRNTYEAEMARLVGATYVPPPTRVPVTPSAAAALPESTPEPGQPAVASTDSAQGALVTNSGTTSINIRFEPSMTSAIVGYLQPNESAPAIGRTSDSAWIAIGLTNSSISYAWVYADTVTLNVPLEQLPTPEPVSEPAPSETPAP